MQRAKRTRPEPIVSILLPVRDAESTLAACLRSVVRQSEARWECVLVDDGSRDASRAIARDFADRDPRFRIVRQPARGLVSALQNGLARCRGAYVARMDGDDWMHRDRLAIQLAALEAEPRLAGLGCHVRLFPRASLSDGLRAYEDWLRGIEGSESLEREALVECPIAHPTLMLRRSVYERFGYRAAGGPEDYDLVLRLLRAGERLAVVPRRLLGWRDGPSRLSRRSAHYALERFTACKAEHLARGLLAESPTYTLWGYGRTAKALRKALLVHGRAPSRIVELHPRRVGQTIHEAPVVPPEALRSLPRQPLVASVSGVGPRTEIRAALDRMGFVETRDYVCAA